MTLKQVVIFLAITLLILVVMEIIYCIRNKKSYYTFADTISNLGVIAMAHCANIATLVPLTLLYDGIYKNYSLIYFRQTWWTAILCFIGCDLAFYWFHRLAHKINIIWGAHIVHHSSDEYNLTLAFRGGVFQRAISYLFYFPLCFLGFSSSTLFPIIAMNLIINGLTHTRVLTSRFPRWFEFIFVTPYHHQVHHAVNKVYWDKNFAGTLSIWDRLFGTYQSQTEPIYYGVSQMPNSWDPIKINTHWYLRILKEAVKVKGIKSKLQIIFGSPSLTPSDTNANTGKQIKFAKPYFKGAKAFAVWNMTMATIFLIPIVSPKSFFSGLEKTILSFFIFWQVHNISLLLEGDKKGYLSEASRLMLFVLFVIGFYLHIWPLIFAAIFYAVITLILMHYYIKYDQVIDREEKYQIPDQVLDI